MATYTAELNQWVQITTNNANNTITAPPTPSQGHWFGVKMLTVTGTGPGPTRYINTIEASPGQLIEDVDGKGPQASTLMGFNYEFCKWIYIGTTWWRMEALPLAIPELWDKDPGSLQLITDTPIPVVNDPELSDPVYFQPNAGAMECVRPFAGTFRSRIYFEFSNVGNNWDAVGQTELYIVTASTPGSPIIKQGQGAVASIFASRGGTFYYSIINEALVVAAPGDIIGLRGSSDIGQIGDTYVVEDTGIFVWPI